MRFLDTNVILRFLTRDDEKKAEACFQLLQSAERGDEELVTCEAVIAEVVYVLSSPRSPYRLSHAEVRDRLVPIVSLRGLKLLRKRVYLDALDLFADSSFLDFEDALSVVHMKQKGITKNFSYDRDFDRVPGMQRIEP